MGEVVTSDGARGMQPDVIERLGDELAEALAAVVPIAPITDREAGISIDDAYAIQQRMIAQRLAKGGDRIVGKKIGATAKVVMEMLKFNQPDFGHLLASMQLDDGATADMKTLIAPRVEGEIAFVLKRRLEGPGVTMADVIAATEYVSPCFEIVDSRIRDWKILIQDTIADNASAGAFVVGDAKADPRKIDLGLVGMTVERNGAIATTGAGAAALGHPAYSVAWLANALGRFGIALDAGEIILSGSLGSLVPVAAGDRLTMRVGGLGSASVLFG